MKPYLAFLSARFKAGLQYRAAALAGVVTQIFWGFIRIMILEAFYSSSSAAQPMSFPQAVSYVWLGQAFLAMLAWNVDRDIAGMIRDGSVSYELVRPLDLYWVWYTRTVAWRTAATLLRCAPLLIIAGLLLPVFGLGDLSLGLPPSFGAFLLWTASMLCALMLSCALTTLTHISLLWTVSGQGMGTLLPIATMIFSGMIIPLPLFPDWMQLFLRLLPFHALYDTPARIFSGNIAGIEAVQGLLLQVCWAAAVLLLGRLLIKRGLRRLVVQGG